MEGNNIKICLVGILVSSFLLFGCPAWLHLNHWNIALAHHFFHANLMHLAVNCFSIWTLFKGKSRYDLAQLVIAYVIGTASWFFSSSDPVGFSNIIFAIVGLRTPSLKDRWWRQTSVLVFLLITLLMVLLPQVSAVTHIVSFALGCMMAGAHRLTQSIIRDFHRASYSR